MTNRSCALLKGAVLTNDTAFQRATCFDQSLTMEDVPRVTNDWRRSIADVYEDESKGYILRDWACST